MEIDSGKDLKALSQGVSDDITENIKIPVKSIRTIYNFYDFNYIKKKTELPFHDIDQYKPYIVHVGSSKKQKRHDILIEAFAKSGLGHRLLLVGSISKKKRKELITIAKRYNILEKVVFIGWSDNPYAIMKHAELLVLSYDFEGLCNVLIEALAVGTRAVSTDCPSGPSEVLTGELRECLAPVGDPEAFSARIIENVGKPLGNVEHILQKFQANEIMDKYYNLPLRK